MYIVTECCSAASCCYLEEGGKCQVELINGSMACRKLETRLLLYLALPRPPLERCSLPAGQLPIRCLREARAHRSKEDRLGESPGEGSSL